jgi:hypothetical protein
LYIGGFFSKTRKDNFLEMKKAPADRNLPELFQCFNNNIGSQIARQSGNNDVVDYGKGNVHRNLLRFYTNGNKGSGF